MKFQINLSDACASNDTQKAIKLLKDHLSDKLDITFEREVCWRLAVSRNNDTIFKALLDYYKATRLQIDGDQAEYRKALSDLRSLMEDIATNHSVTSQSIQDLIDEYVIYDTATDLKNIKSTTSAVGLRVPCLDNLESMEDKDIEIDYVKQVLDQLLRMRHSLEEAKKWMRITKCEEQAKVLDKAIKLLEGQYDLSRDAEEDVLEAYDERHEDIQAVTFNPIKASVEPYNIADWLKRTQPSEFHSSNESLSATYSPDSEGLGQDSNLEDFHA